jgi:hypothetical protein
MLAARQLSNRVLDAVSRPGLNAANYFCSVNSSIQWFRSSATSVRRDPVSSPPIPSCCRLIRRRPLAPNSQGWLSAQCPVPTEKLEIELVRADSISCFCVGPVASTMARRRYLHVRRTALATRTARCAQLSCRGNVSPPSRANKGRTKAQSFRLSVTVHSNASRDGSVYTLDGTRPHG